MKIQRSGRLDSAGVEDGDPGLSGLFLAAWRLLALRHCRGVTSCSEWAQSMHRQAVESATLTVVLLADAGGLSSQVGAGAAALLLRWRRPP